MRTLAIILTIFALAFGAWFVMRMGDSPEVPTEIHIEGGTGTTPREGIVLRESPVPQKLDQEEVMVFPEKFVLHDVPFVSQAPAGRWDDPRQQDGCEEAASYMAVLWARSEKLPPAAIEREGELLKISDWEQENFGNYHDTSTADTIERIFKGYFNYDNVRAGYDITTDDIKEELANGNVIVVLANGQKLGNPYFTPPGPDRHALVIRGYDPETDEFITNDNGTKRGEGYRYKTSVLMGAIVDYPTGDHVPIQDEVKAMIVVRKK